MTTAYSAVDPSTPFEQGGEEPAGLQFGNLYFDIADGRGDDLGTVPVAVGVRVSVRS